MSKRKNSLGKGLSALLVDSETDITSKYGQQANPAGSVTELPIGTIEPNPFQPRKEFDEEALEELTASVQEHGIIQPITVRKLGYDQYQIVSGERRFRAAKNAGLETLPVYIRIANDQTMLEMALIENIQREDLDAIEIAQSYQRLIDECDETQESLSRKVGKKRTTITNYLRLLKLPEEVRRAIQDDKISMGHARALITIEDPELASTICRKIIEDDLSVRVTEALVREQKETSSSSGNRKKNSSNEKAGLSFTLQKYKEDLASHLDAPVDLQQNNKGKGRIVISFSSDEELERIIHRFDL